MATADMCIHYDGIVGGDILDEKVQAERRCKAGVMYADVKEPSRGDGKGTRFPCVLRQEGTKTCSLRRFPTAAELAESEQKVRDYIERLRRAVSGELKECLECRQPVEQYREVRPCVYAEPCGHRQWQGRAPKAKSDA